MNSGTLRGQIIILHAGAIDLQHLNVASRHRIGFRVYDLAASLNDKAGIELKEKERLQRAKKEEKKL